jgi:hypothetical protein
MNFFGKKTELEQKIESVKSVFNAEYEMADVFIEAMREWARLETDYARELMNIKTKIDKVPRKLQ